MTKANRSIFYWLLALSVAIVMMIIIGGVTRLTESGLSMTDWRPATGWLPPLSDSQWQESYTAYMQSPEYQKMNMGMSVEEYKQIFLVGIYSSLMGAMHRFIILYSLYVFFMP